MREQLLHVYHFVVNLNTLMIAAFFATIKGLVEVYLFNDFQYVVYLFTLVMIDSLLGAYAAWIKKEFSANGFGKFVQKMLIYSSFLVMTFVLMNFKIEGKQIGLFGWLDDVLYCSLILREAISIIENAARINTSLVPKFLISRLKKLKDQIENNDENLPTQTPKVD